MSPASRPEREVLRLNGYLALVVARSAPAVLRPVQAPRAHVGTAKGTKGAKECIDRPYRDSILAAPSSVSFFFGPNRIGYWPALSPHRLGDTFLYLVLIWSRMTQKCSRNQGGVR